MASEDEGQRTELTCEERERRATIPLLRRMVSERHHQQHQRCESDALLALPLPVRAHLEAQQPRPVRDHLDSNSSDKDRFQRATGTDDEPCNEPLELVGQGGGWRSASPVLPAYSRFATNVVGKSKDNCWICNSPKHQRVFCPTWNKALSFANSHGAAEIQEGILQHNLKCRDVQAHLNSKRQRLHQVAVQYGLSTNLWTAIVLIIPVLLL
jgi:hypothetical protein